MTQLAQGNQVAGYRRYWGLHELRRLRAAARVGSMSPQAASKERKTILCEYANHLKTRKAFP